MEEVTFAVDLVEQHVAVHWQGLKVPGEDEIVVHSVIDKLEGGARGPVEPLPCEIEPVDD